MQHNLASMTTWEEIEYPLVFNKMDKHCSYDSFLQAFCKAVEKEGGEDASVWDRCGAGEGESV